MEETQNIPNQTATPPQQSDVAQPRSNKSLLVVILVILVAITAMIFFLMTNNRNANTNQQASSIPTQTPVASPPSTGTSDEKAVEQVDVTDTAPTDFPPVEKDVQGL